jgi:hypothetical protein
MNKRVWLAVALVLVGLLAGCGLFGGGKDAPEATAGAPGDETPSGGALEATVAPTDESVVIVQPAVIMDVINEVQADPLAEDVWQDAEVEMDVHVDGRVKTESESTALVGVDEGLIRVAPNTMFVYRRPDEDSLKLQLEAGGQMWIRVDELDEGKTVEVETPDAVASVRGTQWSSRVLGDGTTLFSTRVGTITVSAGAGAPVDVGAGYQTTVAPGGEPTEPTYLWPEEQALWGLAGGPNLDVVLPVVSTRYTATLDGYGTQPELSPSGDYLVVMQSLPDGTDRWPALLDVNAGVFLTGTLPAGAGYFDYAPSGKLAYVNNEADEMCTANEDGTDPSCFRLPDFYVYGDIAWSPDETWLMFTGRSGGVDAQNIYKVQPDGSGLVQLTFGESGYNDSPSWSPDGSQIAYISYEEYDKPGEMWLMDADGLNVRSAVSMTKGHVAPAWSPDGSMIAVPGYVNYDTEEGYGLWMVSGDGSDAWQIPGAEDWWCGDVAWSPTATGWPLFFDAYGYEVPRGGLQWYDPDSGVGPQHFSRASWGPLWPADGSHVLFGHMIGHSDDVHTEVHAFDLEPGLVGR